MAKEGYYIVGIKILGIAMFMYSSWLCTLFLPLIVGFGLAMFQEGDYSFLHFVLLPLGLSLVALIYLIASVGILRLKVWGRVIGIYNTGLAVILSFVTWLVCIHIIKMGITAMVPIDLEREIFWSLLIMIFLFLMVPALFILLFLTRPKIKVRFKEKVTQESKGATIFIVLFAIFHLMGLTGDYESFSSIFKIPEPYLNIYFWFLNIMNVIGLFTVIGLFLLKDSFRKIAIALASLNVVTTIIASPFTMCSTLLI